MTDKVKNPPRPTRKFLMDIADCMKSQNARTIILACAGDVERGRMVADADEKMFRLETLVAKIAHALPNTKSPILRELFTAIVSGTDAATTLEDMDKPLKTLAPKKRKA